MVSSPDPIIVGTTIIPPQDTTATIEWYMHPEFYVEPHDATAAFVDPEGGIRHDAFSSIELIRASSTYGELGQDRMNVYLHTLIQELFMLEFPDPPKADFPEAFEGEGEGTLYIGGSPA